MSGWKHIGDLCARDGVVLASIQMMGARHFDFIYRCPLGVIRYANQAGCLPCSYATHWRPFKMRHPR